MDGKERHEIEQLISKQLDERLWITQRVELAKMQRFVSTTTDPCIETPSDEFMAKHDINDTNATMFIWAALEEWEAKRDWARFKPCTYEGCHNGIAKVGKGVERCPECEGEGSVKVEWNAGVNMKGDIKTVHENPSE